MKLLELALLFFVLLGSKLVLGLIAVYLLLPRDLRCLLCDAEMLPLEHPRGTQRLLRLMRLQRRWCMECRAETLARCVPSRLPARRHAVPVAEPRFR